MNRRKPPKRWAPALAGCVWLVGATSACGGKLPSSSANLNFPATPLMTLKSNDGRLLIEVRSSPQPPSRGLCAFRFTVNDTAGHPVDGLQLSVVPWMPAMGHGASVIPSVTPRGSGVYDVTNVDLFMAGQWQLRTKLSGPVTDNVTPEVQIQ